MLRAKFILIASLAALTACFTIELPFTQVNYIRLLVSKKDHGIANALKDTHRLHKTYYEDPGSILLPPFIRFTPAAIPAVHKPIQYPSRNNLINIARRPNTLRGPPVLA